MKIEVAKYLCNNHKYLMKGRFKDLADGWPKEISFFLTSDQTVHIQFPELPDTVVPLVSVAEQTNWKEEPKMYDPTQGCILWKLQNSLELRTAILSLLGHIYLRKH